MRRFVPPTKRKSAKVNAASGPAGWFNLFPQRKMGDANCDKVFIINLKWWCVTIAWKKVRCRG